MLWSHWYNRCWSRAKYIVRNIQFLQYIVRLDNWGTLHEFIKCAGLLN